MRQYAIALLISLKSYKFLGLFLHQIALEIGFLTDSTSSCTNVELSIFQHLMILLKMSFNLKLKLLICFDHDDLIHFLFLLSDVIISA